MNYTFEQAKKAARDIVEIFDDFLEERGIDIPNPDKVQSENPCVIYGTDYGELVDRVAAVLSKTPATAVAPAETSNVDATFAAVVPLAVRLLEEFATASYFKRPTTWMPIATEKESGKMCSVRMMMGPKGEYEVHVNNEFASCTYHRVSEYRTIVSVSNTLRLIQNDIRNGLIVPF